MTAAAARAVADEYCVALAYREGDEHWAARLKPRPLGPLRARQLGPLRAVPAGQVIDQPWGRIDVRYVVLGDAATTLHATMQAGSGSLDEVLAAMFSLPAPTVTDDRGTSVIAHFDGGSGDGDRWAGRFTTWQPLARDTAWIEVDGQRVELAGQASPPRAWVEPLASRTWPGATCAPWRP
jgi:hypothetical protein